MNSHPDIDKTVSIHQIAPDSKLDCNDLVTIEEPMEIRISFIRDGKKVMQQVSVTMRTPGNDKDLAAGFLYSEGIISANEQINEVVVTGVDSQGRSTNNIVRVDLDDKVELDSSRLQRNFISNSSCGVCGKLSLDSLAVKGIQKLSPSQPTVSSSVIYGLPASLRKIQPAFERTGGIHAAGIAELCGTILDVREDIGRHNAVDKLIGALLQSGDLPAAERIMVVSGRAGFEIVQKAIVAGVPIMVAVGAPSSLAVELATEYKMTLIGFASENRFNIYSEAGRIID